MTQSHYVITYDSDEDRDRRRVRSAIRAYGGWKQYSVFECSLTSTMLNELLDELETVVTEADGATRVRLYKLSRGTDDITTIPATESDVDLTDNII